MADGADVSAKKKPKSKPKPEPKLHPFLKWLRGAGVAAELFGWGGLLLAGWFWPAVASIYLGFLLLSLDLWCEPELRKFPRWRYFGIGVLVILACVFSWGIVFVDAPLDAGAFMTNGEYPIGTKLAGISWKPQFTELQVRVSNPTDRKYEDMDIVIRPSSPVAAIAQKSTVPNVSFEDKYSVYLKLLDVNLQNRHSTALPLVIVATDAGYRLRCPQLPADTLIDIELALVDIKWNPPNGGGLNYMMRSRFDDFSTYWMGYTDGDDYAMRPTSTEFVKIEGKYTVAQRTRTISKKIEVGGNLTITPQ